MESFYLLTINESSDWNIVVNEIESRITHIEFNVLYQDEQLNNMLDRFNQNFIGEGREKSKCYSNGHYLRFNFQNSVRNWVLTKPFNYFYNRCIGDPSFYINNIEVLATITHENQIYLHKDFYTIDFIKYHGLEYYK